MTYLFLFLLQCLVYYFVTVYKHKFIFYNYTDIQKSHKGFTPRVGGIIIIVMSYLYLIFLDSDTVLLETNIIIGSLLIFLIGLKEDLFGNTKPILRLVVILFSSFLAIISFDSYPEINIPYFQELFNYRFFVIFFYTIGLSAFANAINLIDGVNGLATLTIKSVIIGLIILGFIGNELKYTNTLIILIMVNTSFLIFNFPFGKIFLGDTGAYWLGWITGILLLKIFSNTNDLQTWSALLLISYPIIELIFSIIRKFLKDFSPFKADANHLHTKLYFLLTKQENNVLLNSLVTLCLMPLWFLPICLVPWIEKIPNLAFFAILFQIILYGSYYLIIPNINKKIDNKVLNKKYL